MRLASGEGTLLHFAANESLLLEEKVAKCNEPDEV